MPRDLKKVVLLGIVPLLFGTLIYGVWRLCQWPWLMVTGIITILVGVVAFFVGATILVRYLRREIRSGRSSCSSRWIRGVLAGGLLLINFPAATFYTLSVIDVQTRYTIHVRNESDRPIESLIVTGGGVSVELGPVDSGQHLQKHIHFTHDGALNFAAHQQELRFTGQVEGYVTRNCGGDKTIVVKPNAVYEIVRNTD